MSRELLSSDEFPTKPHNCPAVKVPGLIFCAGQTAKGDIKEATTTCLRNLQKVLELGGSSLDKVVKYNVYLADMADFAEMNEAYIAVGISPSALRPFSMFAPGGADRQYIPKPPPSRSCLEAKPPGGMRIEIECIAQA